MFILMKCRMCDVWTLYYSKILSFQETSALLLKDCLISTSHGYTLMLTNIFIKNTLVSKVFWPNVNFVFSLHVGYTSIRSCANTILSIHVYSMYHSLYALTFDFLSLLLSIMQHLFCAFPTKRCAWIYIVDPFPCWYS